MEFPISTTFLMKNKYCCCAFSHTKFYWNNNRLPAANSQLQTALLWIFLNDKKSLPYWKIDIVMLSRPLPHRQALLWHEKQSQTLWKLYYYFIAVLCYDTSENLLVMAYVIKHFPSMNTCCSMNPFNLNTNCSDALMATCSISNTHEILSPFESKL
jgi:hypothetical protein